MNRSLLIILISLWLALGYAIYCIARQANGAVVPGQASFIIPGRTYTSPAGLHCVVPDVVVECSK